MNGRIAVVPALALAVACSGETPTQSPDTDDWAGPPMGYLPDPLETEPVTPCARVHVSKSGSDLASGCSFDTAKHSVTAGLYLAERIHRETGTPVDVWVAEGTYLPVPTAAAHGPQATFRLPAGIRAVGGFAGTELDEAEHDPIAHPTVLAAEGVEHLVTAADGAELDGFIITGGNGDVQSAGTAISITEGSFRIVDCVLEGNTSGLGAIDLGQASLQIVDSVLRDNIGGALRSSGGTASIAGCTFYGNGETAVRIHDGSLVMERSRFSGNAIGASGSSVTLSDCSVEASHGGYGGAMAVWDSSVVIRRSVLAANSGAVGALYAVDSQVYVANTDLTDNRASTGPAIFMDGGELTMVGCVVAGNSAGGAIGLSGAKARIVGSAITDNVALRGGALTTASSEVQVASSIVWGNRGAFPVIDPPSPVFSHSIVQSPAYEGNGNEYADPMLAPDSAVPMDWSPCVNAGSSADLPPDTADLDGDGDVLEPVPLDHDGRVRVASTEMDIGPRESPYDQSNRPPQAVADAASMPGGGVTIDVLANDVDPDGDDLTVTSVGDPLLGGSAVLEVDGRVTYTAAANWAGVDAFEYEVSDGRASDVAIAFVLAPGQAGAGISRISTPQPFDASGPARMSADAGVVAFAQRDVLVLDRAAGVTTVVSTGPGGVYANGISWDPTLSADGRYVAFVSDASNLVPGDTNEAADLFVYDRLLGTLERLADTGGEQLAMSGDGNVLAFVSPNPDLAPGKTNLLWDAFTYDRVTRVFQRVSLGDDGTESDGDSTRPTLGADGSVVAFGCAATNLAGSNQGDRIYVHDSRAHTTRVVTLDGKLSSLTLDGTKLAFEGSGDLYTPGAAHVPQIYVTDLRTADLTAVSVRPDGLLGSGASRDPSTSADGRFVTFTSEADDLVAGDTNGVADVFVRDLERCITIRVSTADDGTEANDTSSAPTLSADGRYVAFVSRATNLVAGGTAPAASLYLVPVVWP